jgi:hypothetical protein
MRIVTNGGNALEINPNTGGIVAPKMYPESDPLELANVNNETLIQLRGAGGYLSANAAILEGVAVGGGSIPGAVVHKLSGTIDIIEDATPVNVLSVTLEASRLYWFKATVIAFADGVPLVNLYKVFTGVYRNGSGSATLAGLTAELTSETHADCAATFTVSGNAIRLTITSTETISELVWWTWHVEFASNGDF